MSRRQLLRSMDAQELLDWQVLEEIDPYGQRREDAHFARLCMIIANSLGAKKENGKPYTAEDMLLSFRDPDEEVAPPQTAAQIEQMFRAIVKANNRFWERREKFLRN